jgi:glycerophosphoryl diester phosphodiesterase
MAFDWSFLLDCHQIDASLRLVALGKDPLTDRQLAEIAKIPAGYVNWDQRSLDAEAIEKIHAHSMQAWTWTADETARMRELKAAGIDAITTNVPARLLQLLAAPS